MSLREPDAATPPLTRRQLREFDGSRAGAAVHPSTAKPVAAGKPAKAVKAKKAPRVPRNLRPPRNPQPRRGARAARKLLSFGALLFAGALAVGMSVPANLFMPPDTFAADAVTVSQTEQSKVAVQSETVSADAVAGAVARDTYGVTSYAELLRAQYGSQGGTFTATTGAIRWPFPYTVPITDGFGWRPNGTSGTSHHNGVDFTPGNGTPIYAIADGVVTTHSDDYYGYGNHVIISHNINGEAFDSLYAHMQTGTSPLNAGDVIKVGDFIGLVGDTGQSYGAHLHFEIRISSVPVDPFAWLQAHAVN